MVGWMGELGERNCCRRTGPQSGKIRLNKMQRWSKNQNYYFKFVNIYVFFLFNKRQEGCESCVGCVTCPVCHAAFGAGRRDYWIDASSRMWIEQFDFLSEASSLSTQSFLVNKLTTLTYFLDYLSDLHCDFPQKH